MKKGKIQFHKTTAKTKAQWRKEAKTLLERMSQDEREKVLSLLRLAPSRIKDYNVRVCKEIISTVKGMGNVDDSDAEAQTRDGV